MDQLWTSNVPARWVQGREDVRNAAYSDGRMACQAQLTSSGAVENPILVAHEEHEGRQINE
jgi:hypothetical protein